MNSFRILVLAGSCAILGACSSGRAQDAEQAISINSLAPQEVVVHAWDFAFDAPATIESGPTVFRLVNRGPEFHHIQLIRFEGGRTLDDLVRHLVSDHTPPEWAIFVGGPNTPGLPGEETNAALDLEPGSYALICVIPSPDGVMHLMKGMARPLTVVPATRTAAMPTADLVMTLDDYSFDTDRPITAGSRTIRVENGAAQPHEVIFVRLAPGKSAGDFLHFMHNPEGTPPGKVVGGTTGIATGGSNIIALDFESGEYALLCMWPDDKDGAPHVAHGMVKQIMVE
jgi:hypothetical protein